MKNVSRRKFLKNSLAGLSAVSLSNLALPGIGLANSGSTKAVVAIQLLGGLDTMLALPYTSNENIIKRLRGDTSRIAPSGLSTIQSGLGVHPGLLSFLISFYSSTKIVMQTGNAFHKNASRSHAIATLNMVTGGVGSVNDRVGWMARLFDQGIKLEGFGGHSASFNCITCNSLPFVTDNYENFNIESVNFHSSQGGSQNSKHVEQVLRQMASIEPQRDLSEVETHYRKAQRGMFNAVDDVKEILDNSYKTAKFEEYSQVPEQISATNSSSSYTTFTQKLRNIAQKLKQMKATGKSEKIVFVLSLGGFDIHDNWLSTGNRLMWTLGEALRVFRSDLAAEGLDKDVITICSSEFGRTIMGNGRGSDHGTGYTSFVTGGSVSGGIYGEVITPANLEAMIPNTKNSWPRQVSQERLIVEILEKHLGINGKLAFPSPYYENIPPHSDLRLIV